MILPPWISIPLAFLKRIPWQLWLVLAIAAGVGLHLYQDSKVRDALAKARKDYIAAVITKQLYKAELDRVLSQLADANSAAKVAIAAKVEAEKAAQKRLQALEKYWRDRYAQDPEARAWADQRVPAGVLDGLRH